jgi:enoyl-CoA hydratase
MMLTGDAIDVEEAYRLDMVSKIYPKDELAERTLAFARRIAKVPTMAALMIKESVNQSVDNMGFHNALQACFTLHQLNHTHWESMHGGAAAGGRPVAFPEDGVPDWRDAPPIELAQKDR